MACCCFIRPRCFFLFLCYMQLLTLLVRQTFDFLGHLWACILVNFVSILVVIIAIFGGHQRRPGYIFLYVLWQMFGICWNVFLICYYLDIGPYTQSTLGDFNVINLGTGSRSWFEANGHGCNANFNISDLNDYLQLIKPVEVIGCHVDYRIIECIQAGIQVLLSINTFCISFVLIYTFSRDKQISENIYGEHMNTTTAMDTALPPYSLSSPRQSSNQRSMRAYNAHASMRKNSQQRSSTRSTKSHRTTRRQRAAANNHTAELYGTYGKQRRHASISRAGATGSLRPAYGNSSSRLQLQQADSSSLDSYGARTNHGYHASRNSLHKEESSYGAYDNHSIGASGINSQKQQHMTQSQQQQPMPSQSNHAHTTLNSVQSSSRHEAIYNIYSSNPYNTYGRSMGRPQQRPSSFCSNASSSSNLASGFVSGNPAGSTFQAAGGGHLSRASPIYMNSETRI